MPEREGGPSSAAGFHVETPKEVAENGQEIIKKQKLVPPEQLDRALTDLTLRTEKPGIRDLPELYKEAGRTAVEAGKDAAKDFQEFSKKLSEEGEQVMLNAYKLLDKVASKLPEPMHFLVRRSEPVETTEDYKKLKEKSAVGGLLASVELSVGVASKVMKDALKEINAAHAAFDKKIASIRSRGEKALGSEPAPKQLPEKTYDEPESK